MLVLGDRFEAFVAVSAAMVALIPVAHLHGGEATEGSIDESIRHSITKMSHLHFVAAEEYRRRVIQLGEEPDRVFLTGGLGLDGVERLELLDRSALESELGFTFGSRNLLITFHPVTLEHSAAEHQMAELLAALSTRQDTRLIFTLPNADTGGRILIEQVRHFVANHQNAEAITSLGQLRYFSCLQQVDGAVGNSSSGLIEVPSFHKGTVNIGDRQRGRIRAASVIDCLPDRESIGHALDRLYSSEFQASLPHVCNPYGEAGASARIVELLESVEIEGIVKKRFFDLEDS
jgi:GDP/UDP-N,N'-diacetylbacillosamine 2-epimerase (hydrolysing)